MNRFAAATAILLGFTLAIPLLSQETKAGDAKAAEEKDGKTGKKRDEPFYRKYLIPGAPLDDRIRQQEKRVEADPTSADLHNDFGNLLAARRFPRQAREQYEIAMKLSKSNFMAPYNLGILEETEGRDSRAISSYRKSIDRNRGFPPARFRLGRLYERRGRNADAIAEYGRALEIDPTMRDVRRNSLAADTRLLDRASLSVYNKEVARVAVKTETIYADERYRRVPTDRPIYSNEIADPPEPEPVDSTRAPVSRGPAPIPAGARQTRPQDLGVRTAPAVVPTVPAPQPTPAPVAPPDPNDPLGLRPRPPLPTPLPQN